MRKIIKWMMVLVMAVGCAAAMTIAAEAATEGGFNYSVSGGEATVTGYVRKPTGALVIPDTLGGYPVTVIGEGAFQNCTGITKVTIPKGVMEIEEYAFANTGLTSIAIPDSMECIEGKAFDKCNALKRVDVTSIEAWCKIEFRSFDANPLYYAHKLYINGKLATVVTIPDSVTYIEDDAFRDCSSLRDVIISEGVMHIGRSTFRGCINLVRVTVPDSVTSIGDVAFVECSSLTSITIPEGVTEIGEGTFYNCSSLKSVTIPESVSSIGGHAFCGCSALRSVAIPENVTEISEGAFVGCDNLKSVTIPRGVTGIAESTFYGCTGLTNVTIHKSVKSIGNDAFQDCTSFKTVFYRGTEADWAKIDIGAGNGALTGAKITFINAVVPGDVTGDGEVNKMDALRLKKYLAGLDVEIDLAAADVNCDGVVNKMDALRLKKYLAGQDVKLGE